MEGDGPLTDMDVHTAQGVATTPMFLDQAGYSPLEWEEWIGNFENYLEALDGLNFRPSRKRALINKCFGKGGEACVKHFYQQQLGWKIRK